MTHTYRITGMTCSGCEATIKNGLLTLPDITSVHISREKSEVSITMEKHVGITALQNAIGGEGSRYRISPLQHSEVVEQTKGWFSTYKPLLLIFTLITIISAITSERGGQIMWMLFMNNFMAGFFIAFSFFKLLDLKGFSESYSTYDLIAKRFKPWGFIYPFVELGLGLAFLSATNLFATNLITLLVMGISSIGVIEALLNKQKIRCACLGAVFNLPMSSVTLFEDLLMIAMSGAMLVSLIG